MADKVCKPMHLQVTYTVDPTFLYDTTYLNLEDLSDLVLLSDGDITNRRKRSATWVFDSLTFTYDLACPLGSPAFLDQCGTCVLVCLEVECKLTSPPPLQLTNSSPQCN